MLSKGGGKRREVKHSADFLPGLVFIATLKGSARKKALGCFSSLTDSVVDIYGIPSTACGGAAFANTDL